MKLNDLNEKKDKLRTLLIRSAIKGVPTTYGDLADQCGIEFDKEKRGFPDYYWDLLMEIGDDEDAKGRPWINALAINKKTRLPGARFYKWAVEKDSSLVLDHIKENETFFYSVFQRCHRYWANAENV